MPIPKMMTQLLAFTLLIGTATFAAADSGGPSKWHGPSIAITVKADDSAYIDTGCGSFSIAAGGWRTDGSAMTAIYHSGLPVRNEPVKTRTVKAQVQANGQLQVEMENGVPTVLDAGAGLPFPHCL